MKKLFLAVLYITFAVFLTAVLLVVRFPKDSFLAYITSRLEERMPGYVCTISAFEYRYPTSLALGTVTFQKGQNGREWVLENMSLSFDPSESLQKFQARFIMYGGSVSLEATLAEWGKEVSLHGLEVSGMDVGKANLQEFARRNVSGTLGFSGNYAASLSEIDEGRLNGILDLTGFASELKRPILMSSEVRFDRISARIAMDRKQLIFSDGEAEGKMYDGTFSGTVSFAAIPAMGSLIIDGMLSPKQEFMRKNRQVARAAALLYKKYRSTDIPFNVTGRLQEPVFRFGPRPQQAGN